MLTTVHVSMAVCPLSTVTFFDVFRKSKCVAPSRLKGRRRLLEDAFFLAVSSGPSSRDDAIETGKRSAYMEGSMLTFTRFSSSFFHAILRYMYN